MFFHIETVTDLCWPFDGDPYFMVKGGDYNSREQVDPFPCYPHSEMLVRDLCDDLSQLIPMAGDVYVYLPEYESRRRTNGWESNHNYYNDKFKFGATIVLNGKRIPPHPAMTRYLISHEYGHAVEGWVEHTYGITNLRDAYCKDLRAYANVSSHYGGKTWHRATGEIFANDFRIMVAKQEKEFWPHPVAAPEEIPAVKEFWKKAKQDWDKALGMLSSVTCKDKK